MHDSNHQRRFLKAVDPICMGLLACTIILVAGHTLRNAVSFKRLKAENFDKVQQGMARAEVELLLGGPPGNYGNAQPRAIFNKITIMDGSGAGFPATVVEELWYDENTTIGVEFWNGMVYQRKLTRQ